MSKSKNNYIGVTETPENMFGKVMSIPDEIMGRYFDLLTDMTPADRPEHPMDQKKLLGRVIVARFHDDAAAVQAQQAFEQRFSKQEMPDDLPTVTVTVPAGEIGILALMVEVGFAESNSEARRLVQGNSVWIGDDRVTDPRLMLAAGTDFPLKVGKLKWAHVILK